jgi:hypothetical protein
LLANSSLLRDLGFARRRALRVGNASQSAQEGLVLTEAQLTALEKAKTEKEAMVPE